jgi:prephenate dehydrogenase
LIEGFSNILIIGLGLIGGSLAESLRASENIPVKIFGVDLNAESVSTALDLGIIDDGVVFESVIELLSDDTLDLVVLATPVDSYPQWFDILEKSGYAGVVTDVGSTKVPVIKYAQTHLKNIKYFIPGHPMAGSEAGGISAARADLFDGAYWILTPDEETDIHVYRRLHTLLASLGARVISTTPAEHDRVIAIVSHVPHIAASSLVSLVGNHAGENGDMLRLAAGGFKDTTRVAAGSPDLWTGILLDNADIIADELCEYTHILSSIESLIRTRDEKGLHKILADAADARRALPAKWAPDSAKLIELRIPMDNRPGIIAEITAAAGRTGCNIQAIEIDHQTEERAVLELILTDEGDIDGFIATLEELKFKPYRRDLDTSE